MTIRDRRKRPRRFLWLAIPAIALAVILPEYLGLLLPGGRVPLWIGRYGVGLHRDGGPVWLWVRSKCVDGLHGWVPPYDSVVVDALCDRPAGVTLQDFFQVEMLGQENGLDPDELAASVANGFRRDQETQLNDSPLAGYNAILQGRDESQGKGPGAVYTLDYRFVATDSRAVAKILRCGLRWDVTDAGPRLRRGACSTWGIYRQVLFTATFSIDAKMTETDLSHTISGIIDRMIDASN